MRGAGGVFRWRLRRSGHRSASRRLSGWSGMRKDNESATFEYDEEWLKNPAKFSFEPALQLGPGPFHTPADTPMFGAIGDSAPDRWGRALMRRMERRRADAAGTAPRTLR